MNRKAFIEKMLRGGLLGALALITGILVARKQVRLERECGLEIACKECTKKKTCQWAESDEG